ncbi:MAG: S41 family peptidase [Lachnospiraceae bacterium]|nr:S41 family peptidase [Lachnospiraceae bacterium]
MVIGMDENQNYFDNVNQGGLTPAQIPKDEKGSGKGVFLIGMIVGIASALLVVAICWLGVGIQNSVEEKENQSAQIELQEDSAIDARVIEKLQTLEKMVDQYYYLGEVTDDEFRDGVYKGLLSALNDPYSEYYTAEELASMMEQSEGIYYGIGAYVSLDSATGLPKISGVIKNSPAEEAELRANDLIYEVDGKSTYGMSLTEAVAMIKGPEGTDVQLTLIREGESDYLELTLTRQRVESPTVEFSMEEDDMAYIQVTEFDDVTVDQFAEALAMARGSGAKGIILDLRGNPGGNLSTVVEMCQMILPEGMIVYTEDKNGRREEYKSDGSRELELPLVVLVDMNSASAAEIMAGAIKDYGTGTLVGTTTFGKGIVQQIMPFRDGSAVKLTISAYYTPSGKNIHGTGIEPDVVCEFDGEAYYASEDHPDNQLEKAKEVLREKMGNR